MTRITRSVGVALAILATGSQSARSEEAAAPIDPFTPAPSASTGGASSANPFRARVADRTSPARAAEGTTPQVARPGGGSRREQADQALLDARRALSVGDLARAQQFLAQAEQLEVAYDGPGDSPQSVAESIRQGQELAELRKSPGGVAAWRQSYSRYLVEQAEALLSWNDLDTAARAAEEAGQLNPRFAAGGTTPQDVLRRVAERRAGIAPNPAAAPAGGATLTIADAKSQTLQLLAEARTALAAGDLAQAQALAGQASALDVPDSQFAPHEDRPSRLAADLVRAGGELGATELADAAMPMTATPGADDYAQAIAETAGGPAMQLAQVPAEAPLPLPGSDSAAPLSTEALDLVEAGEQALRAGDRAGALQNFRAAYERRDQLDVLAQQRLQGHLQMLSVESADGGSSEAIPAPEGELLDSAAKGQSLAARQLSAEIGERQSQAARVREQDPNESLTILREARALVDESTLDEAFKRQLLSRIDHSLTETQKYIETHRAELELEAENQEILDQIERERVVKEEMQNRIAQMVDQFNALVDEHRYAEAEVIANRLYAMAPDDLVAQQINRMAKTIRREQWSRSINEESEEGVAGTNLQIRQDAADALAGSTRDYFINAERWGDIQDRRSSSDANSRRSIKTIEIEQKLDTPVLPRYDETPLTKVVESLSQFAGINIHLDPRGLEQEGVRSDTPISLNLPQEISLKSALTLILEPLHLTYTIKDEVLKITSEDIRDGDIERRVYPVGDLVVPIPNFVPSNTMGLQGLINDAYAAMGGAGYGAPGPMAVVAGAQGDHPGGSPPANIMSQFMAPGGGGQPTGNSAMGGGPGGLGGGAQADFDSLIDLIVSTVEHDSWMENGTGEGEIQPFPTNLSLVISQTQRVHEQIADLLEQLRRLQDLQVTIEVRFIRLTDSFFERIGVDFDFNIEDGTGISTNPAVPNALFPGSVYEPTRRSATVGIQQATGVADFPNYTIDLDLPFRNESFGLTAPQFGTPQPVGTFGFSILSDIEAFFLIEASQGDRRANVLQAPKVTLFNGQQAVVVDSSFVPFVISVIPVVGDFAAAQQPVIVVLSEGTLMTVQAVVSDDRRYVRLTLVPFFSSIGEVKEFTFEGSETTSSSSASVDDDEDGTDEESEEEELVTRSGTTVQLPTFQIISVSTTVSVPDGGTVLLGGIKRLREGRNEFGVPLLSKVPYVDRLFRNVGIGRETDSLMMMVTPHIIIQEEEEERLGVATE